jgi:hypothetical protein
MSDLLGKVKTITDRTNGAPKDPRP